MARFIPGSCNKLRGWMVSIVVEGNVHPLIVVYKALFQCRPLFPPIGRTLK